MLPDPIYIFVTFVSGGKGGGGKYCDVLFLYWWLWGVSSRSLPKIIKIQI